MTGHNEIPSQLFCPFNILGDEHTTTTMNDNSSSNERDRQKQFQKFPTSIFSRNHSKSQSAVLGDALSILSRAATATASLNSSSSNNSRSIRSLSRETTSKNCTTTHILSRVPPGQSSPRSE